MIKRGIEPLSDLPNIPRSAGFTPEFQELHAQPMSENRKIIPWLKEGVKKDLTSQYLFELARRVFPEDKEQAAVWFWLGYLRITYDAYRCTDRSARAILTPYYWPMEVAGEVWAAVRYDRRWVRLF